MGLFQDALQSVRRIFRPRRDLAGLRLFLVAMAGDQGFVRAFLRLPARLWVYRHKRIESYIGIEQFFVSWPVRSACSIQAAF